MFNEITSAVAFKKMIKTNPALAMYYAEERCSWKCSERASKSCKAMKCQLNWTGNGTEAKCQKNRTVTVIY